MCHLSNAQKRAYRLADNKISENRGWNEELLRLELSELESICNDFSLDVTGFSDIEIDVLLDNKEVQADAKSNNIPYISENEIVTQLGDIWNIGKHRIICGNS